MEGKSCETVNFAGARREDVEHVDTSGCISLHSTVIITNCRHFDMMKETENIKLDEDECWITGADATWRGRDGVTSGSRHWVFLS